MPVGQKTAKTQKGSGYNKRSVKKIDSKKKTTKKPTKKSPKKPTKKINNQKGG